MAELAAVLGPAFARAAPASGLGASGPSPEASLPEAYPRLETVWGERVLVGSPEELVEAEHLFRALAKEHWLALDSARLVELIRDDLEGEPGVDATALARVKDAPWVLEELRALYKAAEHFQPIQGPDRAASSRSETWQELHTVGRVNHDLTPDPAGARPSPNLACASHPNHKIAFFSRGTADDSDFEGDPDRQLEATWTHEMAHVVFGDQLEDFVAATPFWTAEEEPSNAPGVEAPPTEYAASSPTEDLAESVMLYFTDPEALRKRCPERYAWVAAQVTAWQPTP
jgi:hypothetical protein